MDFLALFTSTGVVVDAGFDLSGSCLGLACCVSCWLLLRAIDSVVLDQRGSSVAKSEPKTGSHVTIFLLCLEGLLLVGTILVSLGPDLFELVHLEELPSLCVRGVLAQREVPLVVGVEHVTLLKDTPWLLVLRVKAPDLCHFVETCCENEGLIS